MLNLIMKTESSQPAEFVASHGTGLHNGDSNSIRMARQGRREPKMIKSKSFTLGIYPKNMWWEE